LTTDNGEYRLDGISGSVLTIKALGKEMKNNKYPLITTTIDMSTASITNAISAAASFEEEEE